MIKKLVLPSASNKIFHLFGAIKYLHDKEFWNIKNIDEIFSTSAGSIIAVMMLLGINYDIIENYIIERPWNKCFPNINIMIYNFINKGMFEKSILYKAFQPLFNLANININTTMNDFYQHTKIKLNIFVTNLDKFQYEVINYFTHPNIPLIDAVFMSASIPFLTQPIIYNKNIYYDGAFFKNNPKSDILSQDKKNTLVFTITYIPPYNSEELNNNTSFINILSVLIKNIIKQLSSIDNTNYNDTISIKNTVKLYSNLTIYDFNSWIILFKSHEYRKKSIEDGYETSKIFLTKGEINKIINSNIN